MNYGGEGFEDFVTGEFPRLWRLARTLSGRESDASDLVQETLVRVGMRWRKLDRNGNPGAYARVTLARLHFAQVRRARHEVSLFLVEDRENPAADHAPGIEEREAVAQLLETIPPRQRTALVLHYLEDMSIADIASVMRCSEGTVKSQLSRARDALRRQQSPSNTEAARHS